ncbi:MAG: hypothetical protein C4570_02140 [Ammonifex sp.]|nr:MAG: hypothetical protein C4570_02140 [Ammonifex sp.]
MARALAQIYDNLYWETTIVKETEDGVIIAVSVWDPETNKSAKAEDLVKRLVQKKTDKGTIWVTADEMRMREVINRRAAFLLRNCLFSILPPDLVEDVGAQCLQTLKSEIKDPEGEKKRLLLEFGKLGVTVDMLNEYLGHDKWTADDILEMKGVLITINEGQMSVGDYFNQKKKEEPEPGNLDIGKMQAGSPEEHQSIKEPAAKKDLKTAKTPF